MNNKILTFAKKNQFLIFFLIIYFAIISSIVVWLKLDTNLPHWDMSRHLYNTIFYKNLWLHLSFHNFAKIIAAYQYYPPLVYNVTLIFYAIFGVSQDAAVLSNIIWIFILLGSTYQIAKIF